MHRLALVVYKYYIVYIRTMEVDAVVVLLRVVARYEALVLHRIALHNAGCYRLLYLGIQLFERTDALLATVLVAPDRQRCSPEA